MCLSIPITILKNLFYRQHVTLYYSAEGQKYPSSSALRVKG